MKEASYNAMSIGDAIEVLGGIVVIRDELEALGSR